MRNNSASSFASIHVNVSRRDLLVAHSIRGKTSILYEYTHKYI